MNKYVILILACIISLSSIAAPTKETKEHSTRQERKHILAGNKLYNKSKYAEAANQYQIALKENPSSTVGAYNLGLAYIRMAAAPGVKEEDKKRYETEGSKLMNSVASLGNTNPKLASRASYNLGNVAFNSEDYQSALGMYKQALRLNPDDNEARRNLRITQLKLKNQNKDQNKDKNKDKDKEKNKNKDQQDKQDKQDQNKQDQKPPQPTPNNQISEQTADQILKAMENKEAQTRARVMNPQKKTTTRSSRKNW